MCNRALTSVLLVFVKNFRRFGDAQLRPREEHGALSGCSVFITVNRIGHPARPPSEDGNKGRNRENQSHTNRRRFGAGNDSNHFICHSRVGVSGP